MKKVVGEFDVELKPIEPTFMADDDNTVNRMTIDKTYKGDLTASGKGEMLSVITPVKGSAGYVAMEIIKGTLEGKRGAFVVQHSGIMGPSGEVLNIPIIPNSGSEELSGIVGSMNIKLENGKHFYELEYGLQDAD
ncbi:DUF3224 domain-containing protein [Alteromonas sp. ASW11-130]|uniref:DUF3224 domain-containing protein n=1 Tax=Alteromonas sp. ASW11-130 TaxID=3015775 RepID=UPI002241EB04|nr:DUF3224 domain-containing protein [Alteromonas sp. ASW11-130]MCW8091375.1 DUF3224 domain-containing protein [Alteromonas sp. ASW11-130]